MRILHIIPSVSPLRGGPSVAVLGMCRALLEAGVEVEIATTDDDGPGHLDVETGRLIEYQGVPVRFFPRRDFPSSRLTEFQWSPEWMAWLKANLDHYDLLHFHAIFSALPTAGMALARRAGKPYIARPLGQLCHWPMRQRTWLKRPYLSLIERKNLEAARTIHYTSALEEKESGSYFSPRSSFILNHGVDFPEDVSDHAGVILRDRLGIPHAAVVGLFLGRVHPKKRVDVLLKAMYDISSDFHLVVAGAIDPEGKARLRGQVESRGVGSRVHFLGHVGGDEKEACFQAADCFLLPSESENFGIAVAEAMVRGLPVVVSPHLPFAEVVEREGFGLVQDLEPSQWATALKTICAGEAWSEDTPERLKRYGREHFGWPSVAAQLIEQYLECLK